MADIAKMTPGPVEKSRVPGRVTGGRFAAGANNIASAKDGAVGGVGADTSVSPQDRGFHYQDYAERRVEDRPVPEEEDTLPPAIDGSGLNKAPILDTPTVDTSVELAARATESYQSVAKTAKPAKEPA